MTMVKSEKSPNDLRERKRQLTLDRIAEAGLKLFIENGYEYVKRIEDFDIYQRKGAS